MTLTMHPLVPVPSICSSSSEPESPEVDAMFGDLGAASEEEIPNS